MGNFLPAAAMTRRFACGMSILVVQSKSYRGTAVGSGLSPSVLMESSWPAEVTIRLSAYGKLVLDNASRFLRDTHHASDASLSSLMVVLLLAVAMTRRFGSGRSTPVDF